MKYIHIFKNEEIYEKELSKENVINIIGLKGSGKTTLSHKYFGEDYIVVNCDRLLELPTTEKEDKELGKIREYLKKNYGEIKEGEDFIYCYNAIIDYILKKNKKALIEGNVVQDFEPLLLRGKVIILRTAVFKCFIRAVKRDYKNEYFMNLEKEKHKYLYKITRFFKITKRRIKIFKQAKGIDNIIRIIDKRIK